MIIKLIHAIPEKEREEFEFIAGALTISYYRTMKEAFKIGGYAWHAHKRFEEIKNGWTFGKTVEWLKTLGIVFNETSIKRFINVYVTYLGTDSSNTTLRESYVLVNEQAEETLLPREKAKALGRIFTALPSDDSTNPKELIRELIRAAKVFAVTERTIQRWKPESLKQKRLSQEEVQKIQELKEEGKSQREIAEKVGVHEATVSRNLQNDKCQSASTPSYLESDDDEGVGGSNLLSVPCKAFGSIFSSYSTLPGEVSLLQLLELQQLHELL